MKASYTNVGQIHISVDLGISEIETIITKLEASAEGENGWQVKDLLRQLKATKALRRERLAADRLKVSTSYCYASVSSFS